MRILLTCLIVWTLWQAPGCCPLVAEPRHAGSITLNELPPADILSPVFYHIDEGGLSSIVLVAPRVVVTARHVVPEHARRVGATHEATVGDIETLAEVAGIGTERGFAGDWAVLRLRDPIPALPAKAAVRTLPPGTRLAMRGFANGRAAAFAGVVDERQENDDRLALLTSEAFRGCTPPSNFIGASGGGAFADDETTLVGIVVAAKHIRHRRRRWIIVRKIDQEILTAIEAAGDPPTSSLH